MTDPRKTLEQDSLPQECPCHICQGAREILATADGGEAKELAMTMAEHISDESVDMSTQAAAIAILVRGFANAYNDMAISEGDGLGQSIDNVEYMVEVIAAISLNCLKESTSSVH